MVDEIWMSQQVEKSLERLMPRFEERFYKIGEATFDRNWPIFKERLEANIDDLFRLLFELYGHRYDFYYHLEDIIARAMEIWLLRSKELQKLDAEREANPEWFQSEEMLGGVCYVDLFAGDLEGVKEKIPYFKELGLTYLHLMPLFQCPEGENDGGYAVSSYRDVDPKLGTMNQLKDLATELRRNGISLAVDFIFNHTSNQHKWAQKAREGDREHQEYYWMFDDRTLPDQYQQNLRDIFPQQRSGCFTYYQDMKRWVWTTFYSYQWDVNYSNPRLFRAMLGEMLFLANQGVEILRLDAVPFVWKEMGTTCENQPKAHTVVQAYNALLRIVAPAVLFKSEAIVHPDDVVKYISAKESQISYNPTLMASLWNTLATHDVRLLNYALHHRHHLPEGCSWVNYIRSHDDIGWSFANEDAWYLGINPDDHRNFLNAFYTGRFAGSFARGVPFQENPQTGDARISGMLASLAGLEKALFENNPEEIEFSIRRILLLHSVILTVGGIPLIYLGDEKALPNDYSYVADPKKVDDSRWVHRVFRHWDKEKQTLKDPDHPSSRIFRELIRLTKIRKTLPALAVGKLDVFYTGSDHIVGFTRINASQHVMILANFKEEQQTMKANEIRLHGYGYHFFDLVLEKHISLTQDIVLEPYQFMWLVNDTEVI